MTFRMRQQPTSTFRISKELPPPPPPKAPEVIPPPIVLDKEKSVEQRAREQQPGLPRTPSELSPEQKAEYDKIVAEEEKALAAIQSSIDSQRQAVEAAQKTVDSILPAGSPDEDKIRGTPEYQEAAGNLIEAQNLLRDYQNQYEALGRSYQEKRLSTAGYTFASTGPTTAEIVKAHEQTVMLAKGGKEAFDYALKEGLIKDKDAIYIDQGKGKWAYTTPARQREAINALVTANVLTTDDLRNLDINTDLTAKLDAAVTKYNQTQVQNQINTLVASGVLKTSDIQALGDLTDLNKVQAKLQPFIEKHNAEVKTKQDIADRLDKSPFNLGNNKYDIAGALQSKSFTEKDLVDIGFRESEVKEATKVQPAITTIVIDTTTPTTTQRYENEAELRAYGQSLATTNPILFRVFKEAFSSGNWGAFNQAVQTYNDDIAAKEKDFQDNNVKLPDGQWVTKSELNQVKQSDPRVYQLLTTQGITAANNYVKVSNLALANSLNKDISKINEKTTAKDIYRMLTPWAEEKGETVLTYAQGWPSRVVSTIKQLINPTTPTQAELKDIYENQQAARDALTKKDVPLWAKAIIFATNENSVTYNPKKNEYSMLAMGYAPPVGGKFTPKVTTAERVNWSPILNALESGIERSSQNTRQWQTVAQSIQAGITREASNLKANPELTRQAQQFLQQSLQVQKTIGRQEVLRAEQAISSKELQQVINSLYEQNPRYFKILVGVNPEVYLNLKAQGLIPSGLAAPKAQIKAAKELATLAKLDKIPEVKPLITYSAETVPNIQTKTISPTFFDPRHREKVYSKPDVREDFATKLEDVRSTFISSPQEGIHVSTKARLGTIPTQVTRESITTKPSVKPITDTEVSSKVSPILISPVAGTTAKVTPTGKESPRTEPKAATSTKPVTKTVTKTKPPEPVPQTTIKKPVMQPAKPTPSKPKKPLIKLPNFNLMTDAEKREAIKKAGGAFYWQQGQLHGKKVYHVGIVTGGKVIKTTVLGKPPEGAIKTEGKGQAKRTIRVTRGDAPKSPVRIEGGAIDVVVSPTKTAKRVAITFTRDPQYLARSGRSKVATKSPFSSRKRGKIIETRIAGRMVLSRRSLRRRR